MTLIKYFFHQKRNQTKMNFFYLETDALVEPAPLTDNFLSPLTLSDSTFGLSPVKVLRMNPEWRTDTARSSSRRLKGLGRTIRTVFESSVFDQSVACRIVARNFREKSIKS